MAILADDIDLCLEGTGQEIAACTRIIESKPADSDLASAYRTRATAYRWSHDIDHAIADYDQAIRIKPDYAVAFRGRGGAFFEKEAYLRAISDFDEAIRIEPSYTFAYYARGMAYASVGQFDRAIADFDQAARLTPTWHVPYVYRGSAYQHKGDSRRAIEDFSRAILLNPEYSLAFASRGAAEVNSNPDDAVVDLTRAIVLDPKDASSFINRSLAFFNKRDYDSSFSDSNQAITLKPNSKLLSIAYNLRGHSYRAKGDDEKALADFREAVRLDVTNVRAQANIRAVEHDLSLFEFTVCNGSTVRASVAIRGNRDPSSQDYVDQQSWPVSPGQCVSLGKFVRSAELYWKAQDQSPRATVGQGWHGDDTICFPETDVPVNRTAPKHRDECPDDEVLYRFYQSVISPGEKALVKTLLPHGQIQ